MDKVLKILAIFFAVPFMAALGYDLYINFVAQPEALQKLESLQFDFKSFQATDFGYVLVQNIPDIFNALRDMVGEEIWRPYIDPILRQYSTVVAGAPLALVLAIMGIQKAVHAVMMKASATGHLKNFDKFDERARGKRFEYKRK